MPEVSSAQVRRGLDRSHRRKPLRVQITRRRAGSREAQQEFVTQVRFGGREAVVLPWGNGPDRPSNSGLATT
jgi:hypothetical protein